MWSLCRLSAFVFVTLQRESQSLPLLIRRLSISRGTPNSCRGDASSPFPFICLSHSLANVILTVCVAVYILLLLLLSWPVPFLLFKFQWTQTHTHRHTAAPKVPLPIVVSLSNSLSAVSIAVDTAYQFASIAISQVKSVESVCVWRSRRHWSVHSFPLSHKLHLLMVVIDRAFVLAAIAVSLPFSSAILLPRTHFSHCLLITSSGFGSVAINSCCR